MRRSFQKSLPSSAIPLNLYNCLREYRSLLNDEDFTAMQVRTQGRVADLMEAALKDWRLFKIARRELLAFVDNKSWGDSRQACLSTLGLVA